MIIRYCAIAASVCVGAVFIISGATKLWPFVENFQTLLVESGLVSWTLAPVVARILIGLEFLVGAMLLISFRVRLAIHLSLILLIIFSLHLVLQIAGHGNAGDCGCFGEYLPMAPAQALIKNAILIGLSVFILAFHNGWRSRFHRLILSVFVLTALLLPFIINPPWTRGSNGFGEQVNYTLPLDLIKEDPETGTEKLRTDLMKGKHVIAFLSMSCHHCINAARKIAVIKKDFPYFPLYMLLNGDHSRKAKFLENTRSSAIPHSICNGAVFVRLSSRIIPSFVFVENGVVIKKRDYIELDPEEIRLWLQN